MAIRCKLLAWLRRAIDLGNHNYPWFVRDKNWDKLRGDREYERMLAEIRNYADKYRQEFGSSSFLRDYWVVSSARLKRLSVFREVSLANRLAPLMLRE